MTDFFALFGEQRRPWLDDERLKSKFLQLSARWHPDHLGHVPESERPAAEERYAELNTAYQRLRDPRERLRLLLQLEGLARPGDILQVPQDLVVEFMEAGRLSREADALLQRKQQTVSPLLKVAVFAECAEASDKLRQFINVTTSRREHLLETIRTIDAEWEAVAPEQRLALVKQLEQVLHRLTYYDRWTAQLLEKAVQLTL